LARIRSDGRCGAHGEDLGYDAVDINLGCPAKKVVKCGGSGLLRELPLLEDIFKSVRAAVKIPLTIKLRAAGTTNLSSRWKCEDGRAGWHRSGGDSPAHRAKATPAKPIGKLLPR